jgi:D-glycero-D-manno-heptose 1,7-bisphosphate phosphatase
MRAVFLDRDGVINKYPGDKNYVTCQKEFRFLPNAIKAIAKLHRAGFGLFVVSNQAGVGKGFYSQKTLDAMTEKMLKRIENEGGRIEKVFYCTHRPEESCNCRKPMTGSVMHAAKKYSINLKKSFFVGDTIRDVKTAHAAGCTSILIFSGKEKPSNRHTWEEKPDFTFKNLSEAAAFILKQN